MSLKDLLSEHLMNKYEIDENANYTIEYVDAINLVKPERIDLIAKMKYVEHKEKGYDMEFVTTLYEKHIEAFTMGKFKEPGDEEKNSLNKYLSVFDNLIDNIKKNGFNSSISVIPVGSNGAILNGAHRTAIAAYFNIKVPIVRLENVFVNYNTEYFLNRHLDTKYVEYLVEELCKIKDDFYVACLWPKVNSNKNKNEIDFIFEEKSTIIYKKELEMNSNGLHNFMSQIYSNHDWIGNYSNHYSGAKNKADACYGNSELLRVYVLNSNEFENILSIKSKIREFYKVGNHCIHITDNKAESVQLSRLVLNRNSVHFLNNGNPNKYSKFNELLRQYKKNIQSNDFNLEDFLIDSSSVLAVYGLREVNDLDFLTLSHNFEIMECERINNHNKDSSYFETNISNLIYNPENHFFYHDVKFLSPNQLRIFKNNRNEYKDKLDIKLLDSLKKDNNQLQLMYIRLYNNAKRKKRFIKHNSINFTIKLLKRIKLYNFARKAFKLLKKGR